jgi:hypothetical protein
MTNKKDQHQVGIPQKPRGQQTGFAGHPDQNRQEKDDTPAVSGDASEQHIASDPTTPSTNSPSTPAMIGKGSGAAGGEAAFKERLAKKRAGQ